VLEQHRFFNHPSGLSGVTIRDKCGKEKYMPENNVNRVLARSNARQLSAEEYQEIQEKGSSRATQLPSMPFHPDF
jgi:hypothetical protein